MEYISNFWQALDNAIEKHKSEEDGLQQIQSVVENLLLGTLDCQYFDNSRDLVAMLSFSAGRDNDEIEVKMEDFLPQKKEIQLPDHAAAVNALAISSDGKYIISCGNYCGELDIEKSNLRVWEFKEITKESKKEAKKETVDSGASKEKGGAPFNFELLFQGRLLSYSLSYILVNIVSSCVYS